VSAPSPAALSRRRKALYALVVCVVALLGAELALRAVLPAAGRATLPDAQIAAHLNGKAFRYHPDLFWTWADPGAPGSPVNRHGFVGKPDMRVAKAPGTRRVVFFGDSQTFGAGMGPGQDYPAVAESTLGDGWELLNAGISGYRSLHVYRLLRLRMEAFAPDALVIDCMPFDSPRETGPLATAPLRGAAVEALRRFLWGSRLYYMVRLAREKLDPSRPRYLDASLARRAQGQGGAPVHGLLGNHDLIRDWAAERGITPFYLTYPIMEENGAHGCMANPGELPPDVRVIDACAHLRGTGLPARRLFVDRNHLTVEGNAVLGAFVAASLAAWAAEGAPP
jgi:hypothetical protein